MSSQTSSQITAPTFFLYRTAAPGDAFDPTAAIQFYPPKDSDELFDALRSAYPTAKTHSERMRNAVIDFLVTERDAERVKTNAASTPSTWSSWPSNSSSTSTLSSPDLIDLATPASAVSPMPSLSRQPSRSSAGRSSMEQMTGVFSLSAKTQPKTRVRRKMTESEKAEYKKRRIVKACDKCSKRKRKCHHNQEQMEVVNASGKITKRKSPSSSTPSFHQVEQTSHTSSTFDNGVDLQSFLTDDSMFSLETINQQAVSAEPSLSLMDFDFDPQIAPTGAWPWSDTQDWTLLDAQPVHNPAQSEPLFDDFLDFSTQFQSPQQMPVASNVMGSLPTSYHSSTPNWHGQPVSKSGLDVNPDVTHGDRHIDCVSPASLSLGGCQPIHSGSHYEGSDRDAFIRAFQNVGPSENASSTGITANTLQMQASHQWQDDVQGSLYTATKNILASHECRRKTPVQIPVQAQLGNSPDVPHPSLLPLQSIDDGVGSTTPSSGARRTSSQHRDMVVHDAQLVSVRQKVKNKGPQDHSHSPATLAGLCDRNTDHVTDLHNNGGNDNIGTHSDVRHSTGGSLMPPTHHISAEQVAAERLSTADTINFRREHVHIAPAFARGLDFTVTDSEVVSSSSASGTLNIGLVSATHRRDRRAISGYTVISRSSVASSSTVLSPELAQAFSVHNSSPVSSNKQRVATTGSTPVSAPMTIVVGGNEHVLSLTQGQVVLDRYENSAGTSSLPHQASSSSSGDGIRNQLATSWAGHTLRNPHTIHDNAPRQVMEKLDARFAKKTALAVSSEEVITAIASSGARTSSPASSGVASGSSTVSTSQASSSSDDSVHTSGRAPSATTAASPASVNEPLRHKRRTPVPSQTLGDDNNNNNNNNNNKDGKPAEDRPFATLASESRFTAKDTHNTVLSNRPAHARDIVAVTALSAASSGYLLRLASALTEELLKSMGTRNPELGIRCAAAAVATAHGRPRGSLQIRRLVLCV